MNGKNKGSSLDPSSLVNDLISYAPKIVAMGIGRRLNQPATDKDGFVDCLTVDDLNELKKVRHIGFDLKRLIVFSDQGLWNDAPMKTQLTKNTNPKGGAIGPKKEEKSSPYLPIPDEYLAEMGPPVLWLVHDLGPNMLHLLETIPDLFSDIDVTANSRSLSEKRSIRLISYFEQNVWRDRDGQPITSPPFYLRTSSGRARSKLNFEWPLNRHQLFLLRNYSLHR